MKNWTVELLPGVVVHAYLHQHQQHTCWSYLTEGLRALDQSELAFCWPFEDGDVPVPPRPLEFFDTVCRAVAQGGRVGPGDVTGFAKGSEVFGRKDVTGVLYVPCPGLEEIAVPPETLSVIPLLGKELERVRDEGGARFMARQALRTQTYPYPNWFDRQRKSERLKKGESVLGGGVPVIHSWLTHAWSQEGRLTLRIPYYERDLIARALENIPVDRPFALLTGIAPEAEGILVWRPGQRQAAVLAAPGAPAAERLSGNFFLFATNPEVEVSLGEGLEDGFRLILSLADHRALRRTLCRGEAFELDHFTLESSNHQVMLLHDEAYLEQAGFQIEKSTELLQQILGLMQATLQRDELRGLAVRVQLDAHGQVAVMFPEALEFASKNQLGLAVMALPAPPLRLPVQLELHCQL
ncbi:hypothetical protein ABS71_09725 [bacterium SCN 62-11]|nr:MAG: hypothetical protein ABS71_09725 [bacterium SCN 62-11]